MPICQNCQKETTNPRFCSRSCSAKITNKETKRKKPKPKICKNCKSTFTLRRSLYCSQKCFSESERINPLTTIAELLDHTSHRASVHSRIREGARRMAKKLGWKSCKICGYLKHIEIAHKKDIKDFPLSTPISIVNNPNNLVPLCPTHHWEFDNDALDEYNLVEVENVEISASSSQN